MAMPHADATYWTPEMVLALPEDEGKRYECIDGELLVTPTPRPAHQWVVMALFRQVDAHLRDHGGGVALCVGGDLQLGHGALVIPDLFVLPPEFVVAPRKWSDVHSLLLAVEVLSPSTARRDRGIKRRYFQRAGIPEYWIVDADARLIERWRPGDERPEVVDGLLEWRPSAAAIPLRLDVQSLFASLPGEE